MLTETWRNLITPPWTQCNFGTRVHKFQECTQLPSQFQIVSETRITRFVNTEDMPRCLATSSSQHFRISALTTFELVTAITLQTWMVFNSFKIVIFPLSDIEKRITNQMGQPSTASGPALTRLTRHRIQTHMGLVPLDTCKGTRRNSTEATKPG